jgi:hypothetical protein
VTRRTPGEMRTLEQRTSGLIAALRESGDPVQLDVAGRLWRCQRQRDERREGLRDRVDRPCRHVACEHCRRWVGREWRERAAKAMADAENRSSSHVTILLACTGILEDVRPTVEAMRRALRNLRNRRARKDHRWKLVSMVGLAEVDIMAPEDVVILPPDRRVAVPALPVITTPREVLYVIHVHLAISHPGISRDDIKKFLVKQWPGPFRVDVKDFREMAEAPENVGGIIAYAAKREETISLNGDRKLDVPVAWIAAYWGYLHSLGSGLSSLRVRISAVRPGEKVEMIPDIEAMPVSFGWW